MFDLPEPPFYFPLRHGRYDVAPGLTKFGRDVDGGDADAYLFQFDRNYFHFRSAKLASRERAMDRYVCRHELSEEVGAAAAAFITARLAADHPRQFMLFRSDGGGGYGLRCVLSDDLLFFDNRMGLAGKAGSKVKYVDALDALACQLQEDIAIVSTSPDRHWLSYTHVCLPNGWAPAEKIGKSFAGVHEPVAGMAAMNQREREFSEVMVSATDGLVRFAWGVTFDDELNHHPDRPRAPFDSARPRAFLRVERQTIWGFPRVGAALFTIRTYLYDCNNLRRDPAARDPLVAALRTMPPESLRYKGIAPHADDLLAWLSSP